MKNIIQELRNRLDYIEEDAAFDQELLEALETLFEDSELIKSLGDWDDEKRMYKDEQGVKLAKHLHTKYKVSDQAKLVPYSHPSGNLDLMSFKGHYDNFMILHGPNGWAAFKPKEDYLRKQLDRPGYDPSKDRNITYIGVFSLEQPVEDAQPLQKGKTFFTTEIEGTRGGRYDRPEKKEVTKQTIADRLKEFIGKSGVRVYRLMERDPEDIKQMDPQRLMGKRSATIPTSASVQRQKMSVRTKTDTQKELGKKVASKFSKIKDKILKQVEIRRMRAGDEESRGVAVLREKPEYFEEVFWPDVILATFLSSSFQDDPEIESKVENYKNKTGDTTSSPVMITLKLAAGEDTSIWPIMLKYVRDVFERKVRSIY